MRLIFLCKFLITKDLITFALCYTILCEKADCDC